MKTFTQDTFKEDIKSDKLSLVDFYTPACGPCKKLAPTIEKLAHEYADAALIGKCDATANVDLSVEMRISAVPTLIFFKNGTELERHVGLMTEEELKKKIEQYK